MKWRRQIVGEFEPESFLVVAGFGDWNAIQMWKGEHGTG